jgi:peptidoglycan/LPS O-acetylase OafA/YrhL
MRRWGRGVLLAIFLGSVAYNVVALHFGAERFAKQLPGQMQFFVVGIALYLYGERIKVPVWVSAVVTLLFLAAWTWLSPIPAGIRPLIVGAFVFCFALRTPVLRMKSDMSYSVYLVHGPLIQTLILLGLFTDSLLFMAVIVAGVLLLAFIAERLVERPGNEFGRRLSVRIAPRPSVVPRVA